MNAKKHLAKLMLAVSFSALALALLAGATYAWFVLSTQPEMRGAKVTVGAKNTIQIAADTLDGEGKPAPGDWGDYVQLDGSGLGVLSPVSTVDGVHWVLPEYQQLTGVSAMTGSFTVETNLAHANQSTANREGGYVYLDFWVKSPEACKLRVSTEFLSDPSSPGQKYLAGCFAVAAPEVGMSGSQLILSDPDCAALACVRVGFLTEGDEGTTRFAIYEPNADYHPGDPSDHSYHITQPLDANAQPADVSDRVSVQLHSSWRTEKRMQDFISYMTTHNITTVDAAQQFMTGYCLTYMPDWLIAGHFFASTEDLYQSVADGADWNTLDLAGATEDVWICSLAPDTPKRIRLFIWLEGADDDCVFSPADAELLIRLELAGDTTG